MWDATEALLKASLSSKEMPMLQQWVAGWREMNDYMAEKNISPVPAAGVEAATASGRRSDSGTDGR